MTHDAVLRLLIACKTRLKSLCLRANPASWPHNTRIHPKVSQTITIFAESSTRSNRVGRVCSMLHQS